MLKKIPFIRTGKFTDKNGTDVEIKDETLNKIIEATEAFPYQNGEIPLVIGHPKEDSPAWGWVNKNSIEKSENILNALADDKSYAKEFKEWLDKKLYKTVSVALRPDWSIKHIGFLGAMPPAITGLPAVELSESAEDTVLEFSESELKWTFKSVGSIFRKLKNWFIEKEGTDKAEDIFSEWSLEDINNPPEPVKANSLFTEPNKEETETDMDKEKEKELSEKISAQSVEIEALKKEKVEADRAVKRKGYIAFCESADVVNKIVPAQKQSFIELMELVDKTPELEFTEGTETKKLKPLEFLENLIKQMPNVVSTEHDFANNRKAVVTDEQTAKSLAAKATEFMAAQKKNGIEISYAEAVSSVQKEKGGDK